MALNMSDKKVQEYTDIEIIQQVLAGNTAVFEIIIRRYNPYLYKVGRSYGYNHQDTEDLMQEAFINSYVNLKQFAERSSFKTWLIRIMLNQCYRKAHKFSYQKEQTTDILPDNSSFMLLPNHSNTNDAMISKEFNKVVEACLQQLPQEYRTTFTLRELTGLSVAETAEAMNTTTSNVKVRLNRAKAMLRKEIEKTYSTEDIYEFNLVCCDRIVNGVMKQIDQLGNTHLKFSS
ncbi:sigma-70 family RNA polymerase sigma factor [Niastella sp. OAS944]|uniref:sigma-70 family RNA polymerase sigma factor n=1 Tax=Niastella sp. OAS944 TaxID=2664089 RepID=UPI003480C75E|nr:RNA polymerase sigma-70 factor (ECF subfamily) [Chitinophagaceae bacterium OAS944]